MIQIKGTDLLCIKKLFKEKYRNLEEQLLSTLDPETRSVYDHALAFQFIPAGIVARIYETAAQAIYPGQAQAVRYLFGEIALKAYSGIYSLFLRIPSPAYIIGKAAAIWRSYYSEGDAGTENSASNSLDFTVANVPDLPKAMRDATVGHLEVLMVKGGKRNTKVTLNEKNPQKWVWHLSWE
jgi:hypothetical protein